MEMLYRILKYLKLTLGKGMFFKKGTSHEVEVYSDPDWARSISDRRSTSGFCFFLFGGILLLGRVKSSQLLLKVVLKLNFELWLRGFENEYG